MFANGARSARAMPDMTSGRDLFRQTFDVSRETLDQLDCYAYLLEKWQPRLNLVGSRTLDEVWTRHFADSAQVIDASANAKTWVDLGSGGGFPGLVIAILIAQKGGHVTLVESDQRKCAFLREVIRQTGAPASIRNERVETVLPSLDVDVVTSRALASLAQLLDWTMPLIEKGTRAVFLKGRTVHRELTEIRAIPNIRLDLVQSRTDPDAHLVLVRRSNQAQ